ncbi:MAG: EGFR-like transmembrane domain-containing protein [Candidatus Kariarchaeaceae archaeon]
MKLSSKSTSWIIITLLGLMLLTSSPLFIEGDGKTIDDQNQVFQENISSNAAEHTMFMDSMGVREGLAKDRSKSSDTSTSRLKIGEDGGDETDPALVAAIVIGSLAVLSVGGLVIFRRVSRR